MVIRVEQLRRSLDIGAVDRFILTYVGQSVMTRAAIRPNQVQAYYTDMLVKKNASLQEPLVRSFVDSLAGTEFKEGAPREVRLAIQLLSGGPKGMQELFALYTDWDGERVYFQGQWWISSESFRQWTKSTIQRIFR